MNNYNIYGNFMNNSQISSARQMVMRQNTRNPIIETDKNIEILVNHIKEIQICTNKQFKISLMVAISAVILAFGSFVLSLIQFFK